MRIRESKQQKQEKYRVHRRSLNCSAPEPGAANRFQGEG